MKVIIVKYWRDWRYLANEYNHYFTGIAIDKCNIFCFYKNGKLHREDGYASFIYGNNSCLYYSYKDKYYGKNDDFTIKTWKKKVKELKREEKLKVFQ